ncbi:MAG: hypothetical protein IT361_03560 [Gemmatimonadaceae bacterium]|nr:hypothetical protein [Gemmatimonadaceae bacterium]
MTDDEKFDTWLTARASEYNEPPKTVPREPMWEAIRASLDADATVGMAHRRRVTPIRWLSIAAAAAVLVVVSFQVGRWSRAGGSTTPDASSAVSTARTDNALYTRAAEQHLGRADALLTTMRSATDDIDPALQAWARDLLADTRLLIDSPAATDALRRRLLQDLELTLAQIVQLPAATTPDDRQLVERALQRGELLTRIRTAVPSTYSGT